LEGTARTRDLAVDEAERIVNLEAEVVEDWMEVVPLEELHDFPRQVTDDIFFDNLLEDVKNSLMRFQNFSDKAEKYLVREWTKELLELKRLDYEGNFDRIRIIEDKLNDSSEKQVMDRLPNLLRQTCLTKKK
jgi:hypothetical protein